ncbi:unnamed protein product [Parajaminaea phylloscopi]
MTGHHDSTDVAGVGAAETANMKQQLGDAFDEVLDKAHQAAQDEQKDLSVIAAFRTHWKAALFSMGLSFALVMEGYDVVVINSFYGQSTFLERFGDVVVDGKKAISAPWQTGLSNSALVGEVAGLFLMGWLSDKIGYRWTYMGAMVVMAATIFAPVFAQTLPQLSVGEILMGVPWGIFQTLTTAYAAEICPVMLRPYLTSFVCFCWGLGIFLSSIVTRATLNIDSQWSWRLPFVLQWVWPVPLLAIAYFAPESPWFLVRKNRVDEAAKAVDFLKPRNATPGYVENHIEFIRHTEALERAETEGASYLECFRGVHRRRTEIVCIAYALQWWCGNPLMSYSITFFERAGLKEDVAFDLNIVMNTTYMIGTVSSWFLTKRFGRRAMYIWGCIFCCTHLVILGILGCFTSESVSWATGALLITFALFYNFTIGPICYCIVSEIPSARLRAKSISLARLTYVLTGLITNTLTPRMLSPTAWNWGSKAGFLYLGTCTVILVWCIFRLPETKDRTTAEIDELFAHRLPARKFASTKVDLYSAAYSGAGPHARVDSLDEKSEKAGGAGVHTLTVDA